MNIYPTDEQLEKIRKWEVLSDNDFIALMKYVHSLWEYADYGYWLQSEKNVFIIATAGWSGNEDIISALQENVMFWTLYWYLSQRGGKYIFCPQSVHLPAFENRITELEQENARLREAIEKIREITAEFSYDRKLEQIRDIVNQLCQPPEAEC